MDQLSQEMAVPEDLTWIEKAKIYAIEVVLRKVGPAAFGSLLSLATAFILAHQGAFEAYGVNYIPTWSTDWLKTHEISGQILLLELDTTSLKAISTAIAVAVAFFVTGGHHLKAAIKGTPQSGDKRDQSTGGQRATDQ